MKIRTDFVTNSSSSSFICSVIITDKKDKNYTYSLSDAYDSGIMEDIGCCNHFVTGLDRLARKTTGSNILGTGSVAELVELLTENIEERNDYDWDSASNEVNDNKKKYLKRVTSKIKALEDIKKIEFRMDVFAYGDNIDLVPSELMIPDSDRGYFEGFESTTLDVATNVISYTSSKIQWEEENPEEAAEYKEKEAKQKAERKKKRAEDKARWEAEHPEEAAARKAALDKWFAEYDAREAEKWMEQYGQYLEKDPTIVFNGKKFVFTGLSEEQIPIAERLSEKGGLFRQDVSGVTDYLVVNPAGAGEKKMEKVIEMQKAGKPVKAVLFDDFEKALLS